jgi:hypothetical protein
VVLESRFLFQFCDIEILAKMSQISQHVLKIWQSPWWVGSNEGDLEIVKLRLQEN